MKYIVTGKEMKLLDQNTSEHFHVPTVVLMEQAAVAFVQKLVVYIKNNNRILIVCGNGNNGADGLAVARLLNQQGYNTKVVLANDSGSELFNLQKRIYTQYGYNICESIEDEYEVYIDAIFGIGLSRAVEGKNAEYISAMNQCTGLKIALDMPSGINSDDGQVLGEAFRADYTITFSFAKIGQLLWPGSDYSGDIIIADMGITKDSFLDRKPKYASIEACDKLKYIPKRKSHSNKGTYGRLLIIAGGNNMAGAACLCARAAYRSGVGLVKVLSSESNRVIIQNQIPEAILETYDKSLDEKLVIDLLKWADAVVLGPGIGVNMISKRLVSLVLKNINVPLILDADALNIIAENTDVLLRPHLDIIVTPHLGEMARLTGYTVPLIQSRMLDTAMDFAIKYDLICVLKDFHTITAIPYGITYINLTGNNGMATAGSGDVLSGILGSLLAQGIKTEYAAALGVYIHGEAGDNILNQTGEHGMLASDIIEGIRVI